MRRSIFKRSFLLLVAATCASTPVLAGVSGIYDAANTLLGEYAESVSVIHSAKGFRFSVDGSSGTLTQIATDVAGFTFDTTVLLYSSGNCTGQAYVTTNTGSPAGGLVFLSGSKGPYYIAKTPTQSVVAMGSSWNGVGCNAITPSLYAVVPAQPNDPATTGVPNSPFVPPLRLEIVPLSQYFRIFINGFESSYFRSPQSQVEQRVA